MTMFRVSEWNQRAVIDTSLTGQFVASIRLAGTNELESMKLPSWGTENLTISLDNQARQIIEIDADTGS